MDTGGDGVKSEINVTPLVDVVLVLLIIFMVVTPLLQRGKAVQLPTARQVSELRHGGEPILLSITPDGRTWLGKNEVELSALAGALEGELAARPGAPVVVKGDRSVDYKTVRAVILEISKARVAGVSLAASQPREGGER